MVEVGLAGRASYDTLPAKGAQLRLCLNAGIILFNVVLGLDLCRYYTIMGSMRNNNAKGNTMTIDFEHGLTEDVNAEDAHNTTWSECECNDCTSSGYVEGGVEKALLEQRHFGGNGFENRVGDGPSGFDYHQDTKWSC